MGLPQLSGHDSSEISSVFEGGHILGILISGLPRSGDRKQGIPRLLVQMGP